MSCARASGFVVVAALVFINPHAAAQQSSEVQSETPVGSIPPRGSEPEITTEPMIISEPAIITEPPELIVPQRAVPWLEFDQAELDKAKSDVLWNRNWFLASGATQALGWLLLGAAFSQCDTINGVDVCPSAADKAGVAGAAIVILSGVPLLVTSITYGVRARQKKELERLTLRDLTKYGRASPLASFDRYRLDDAKDRIRRARNGLIGSASMFAFGWIFLGAAIPRCQSTTDGLLDCTDAGSTHMVIGLTFSLPGAIGMLVSGALLGSRKRNERLLLRSIQRREEARFRWDPERGAFVF
ncbi:MAG: hypothetical protein WBM48_12905 [Polyangiales bacterium]|jgi:hypothetical protein